jgi:hypothetical protein
MVKTRLIPTTRMVTFEVPESFVGKEVDINVSIHQAPQDEANNLNWLLGLKESLTQDTFEKLKIHVEKSREEWD